jgi:hypothetical protein
MWLEGERHALASHTDELETLEDNLKYKVSVRDVQ